MNILIFNWRDIMHPLGGGAEISLFEHAKYWRKQGANITWITSSFNGAEKKENIEGIRVIRIGSYYTVHILAYIYFKRHLEKKIDIVIDCFHFIPYFTPLYIKKSKIIALINEPAKNAWFKNIFFPASLIGYLSERFFFGFYKNIPFITSAHSIADELTHYNISSKEIHIIPHGVTLGKNKKYSKESVPTILSLSQLSKDKGIEDALKTFSILKKTGKNFNYWIVGKANTKEYREHLKRLAEELAISGKIVFFGFVSEEEKWKLLSRAWVLIHPSIREGWGLNVIEANSVGTPAVGYNVTGLKDSIQNMKTGLITSKNTPVNLAEKIKILLTNKELYGKLSRNAIEWSGGFTWEESGRKSWKLIKTIYEKR